MKIIKTLSIIVIVSSLAMLLTNLMVGHASAALFAGCTGDPHDHDSGPTGNPHDGNEIGNPHDSIFGHHEDDHPCPGAAIHVPNK